MPGDSASAAAQFEAFDVVRERLGLGIAEALAAYGRAGNICRTWGDPWATEPEGARIALEVRMAVNVRTFPENDDDGHCDLRCSVRDEADPCHDW